MIWLTYRGVFPVGITLIDATGNNDVVAANAIGNYSFVYAKTGTHNKEILLARCVTGLGPSGSNGNAVLGGVYFNGRKVKRNCADSQVVLSKPGNTNAGVLTIKQCGNFSTTAEGIYTCIMMNSLMMIEYMIWCVLYWKK